MPLNIRVLRNHLKNRYPHFSFLTIELILGHILNIPHNNLLLPKTNQEKIISLQQLALINDLLQRHQLGEPLAYLLGTCEFWSLTLEINNAVLVPRPETELLVDIALKYLNDNVNNKGSLKIAELGTGSGAITLALAHERHNWHIYATDINVNALKVAQNNAEKLNLHNITFTSGDWCNALPLTKFDAIISNPPYVALNDPHLKQNVKQFEPSLALFAGADGLDAIRIIISQAPEKLINHGWLMLEHGFNQGNSVRKLMANNGFSNIITCRDLAGHERVTISQK